VVLVLMMGMTLSLADRLIMGLMIAPMRHDLSLSNTEISLLHGLAFTILYVLAGLPLGRFAIADHLFAGPRGLSVGISIVAGVGAAGSAICLMTARTQRHRLNLVQQG
jgi:hypothetical protein